MRLVGVRVVVEVALAVNATGWLLGAPDLLVACRVWEWLWEGGWGGRKCSSLFGGEVLLIVQPKVQVQAIGVTIVWWLLVRHLSIEELEAERDVSMQERWMSPGKTQTYPWHVSAKLFTERRDGDMSSFVQPIVEIPVKQG